jgi:hypothetical protein
VGLGSSGANPRWAQIVENAGNCPAGAGVWGGAADRCWPDRHKRSGGPISVSCAPFFQFGATILWSGIPPPADEVRHRNGKRRLSSMNPIVEPLSEQAWSRVEKRILDELQRDALRDDSTGKSATRRFRLPWPCELARAVLSMRYRVRSWLDVASEFGRQRAPVDAAPESSARWRAGSVTGVRMALPSR